MAWWWLVLIGEPEFLLVRDGAGLPEHDPSALHDSAHGTPLDRLRHEMSRQPLEARALQPREAVKGIAASESGGESCRETRRRLEARPEARARRARGLRFIGDQPRARHER